MGCAPTPPTAMRAASWNRCVSTHLGSLKFDVVGAYEQAVRRFLAGSPERKNGESSPQLCSLHWRHMLCLQMHSECYASMWMFGRAGTRLQILPLELLKQATGRVPSRRPMCFAVTGPRLPMARLAVLCWHLLSALFCFGSFSLSWYV